MSKDKNFGGLSDELKATLKGCTTEEEMEKALADAGLQLDDDLLKAVSGGVNMCMTDKCHDVFAQNNAMADGLVSAEMLAASCTRYNCMRVCRNQ